MEKYNFKLTLLSDKEDPFWRDFNSIKDIENELIELFTSYGLIQDENYILTFEDVEEDEDDED